MVPITIGLGCQAHIDEVDLPKHHVDCGKIKQMRQMQQMQQYAEPTIDEGINLQTVSETV